MSGLFRVFALTLLFIAAAIPGSVLADEEECREECRATFETRYGRCDRFDPGSSARRRCERDVTRDYWICITINCHPIVFPFSNSNEG